MDHPSPSDPLALDHRLQQYVRLVAARDRDVERIGPFTATFDPRSTNPYLSYAFPDDGAEPTGDDVAALVAAARRRDRVPRLEFLPAVAPAVESALLAAGFVVEARLAVMTCTADTVVALAPPDGVAIEAPATDDDVHGMRLAQSAAFGLDEPAVDDGEVARLRASLADGALAVLARDVGTGAVVGGGVATVPAGGLTEVAGIGVRETHRGRGVAGAITSWLAQAALDAGQEAAWLTPGHDEAHRIYARAGFVDATEMVHISLPAS